MENPMIPASGFQMNPDGTAWWVPEPIFNVDDFAWAKALDRPCDYDSCHDGWIDTQRGNDSEACEHCDGTGRHTFTVEVGDHSRPPSLSMELSGEAPCDGCVRTHRVSVVSGMVLPIRKGPGIHPVPVIVLYDDGVGMWQSGDDEPTVLDDFPSAAKPGMWAVKLEVHR
jgi:hypothetical protein